MSNCRRNNTNRNIAAVMLIYTLFAMGVLGGCSRGEAPEDGTGNGTGGSLNSPIEINYLVENPITQVPVEEQSTEGQTDNFYYRSITITGLKDQKVQQNINDRLTKSFENMKANAMPPYRGIKILIPQGSKLTWENVSMDINGCFNNVLSVTLNKYASYAVPDAGGTIVEYNPGEYRDVQGFSTMECLNFDLNTGEEIPLKDVFTDDAEYEDLLNSVINAKLQQAQASEEGYFDMNLYNLKLVKPFTGIIENQTFFINNFGLSMVFDYRTPEFETNMQAVAIYIPWAELSGKAAVTERYYDVSENLFTSEEPPAKILLSGNEKIDRQEQNFEKIGRVNVYTSTSYSSSYHKNIQDKILELYVRDENEIERMNRAMESVTQEFTDQYGEAYYEMSVGTVSAGHFVSVAKQVFTSLPAGKIMGNQQWREYYCFDKNTGEEVQFKDLFKENYDPSTVVKKAIRTSIENDLLSYGDGKLLSQEEKDRILGDDNIDRLYENIHGVLLYTNGLNPDLPSLDIGDNKYLIMLNIEYKDFGSDNLNIYDED